MVEVDRYIVVPGQALAYKLDELGDQFAIRAFHDQVLGDGSLPLRVLEKNIHEWVADL